MLLPLRKQDPSFKCESTCLERQLYPLRSICSVIGDYLYLCGFTLFLPIKLENKNAYLTELLWD